MGYSENENILNALISDAVEVTLRRTYDSMPDRFGKLQNERLQLHVRFAETECTFSVLGNTLSEVLTKAQTAKGEYGL